MIRIRSGIKGDLPALKAMLREFTDYLNAIDPGEGGSDVQIAAVEDLVFGEEAPARVLIAEQDDETIGYLIYFHGVWMDPASRALFVADLFVRAPHRGSGTGQALMEEVRKVGAASGARHVVWTVWRKNPASIRFYERLGARVLADELLMSWPMVGPAGDVAPGVDDRVTGS